MARGRADIGADNYRADLKSGHHALVADERALLGGGDAGPAHYEYLLSALGSCPAITLRMYAERKQWDLQRVRIDLRFALAGADVRIDRAITTELGDRR